MFDEEKATADIIARHCAEFPDERPAEAPNLPDQPGPEARLASGSLAATPTNTASPARSVSSPPKSTKPSRPHCKSVVEALAPVGALEPQLAQSNAEGHWRLNRPAADFPSQQFVFSSAEIEPLIRRKQRLHEARAGLQMPAAG